ncbi:hypothetical protein HMPREF0083_00417 [Aneurinibacillus aneurinilyticus ATCC 12856]|uniref:Uncharacterized protein n=1 Tax=Aneurinibacillus aneurinilyticus ATCC 12856 TaxID=649747 RepID=U1X8Y3_ANEAE|nr:hypothetical protein HMPREF0083_00417 [Aneurinibacillus aneurinilyticus ATCC 12856]
MLHLFQKYVLLPLLLSKGSKKNTNYEIHHKIRHIISLHNNIFSKKKSIFHF